MHLVEEFNYEKKVNACSRMPLSAADNTSNNIDSEENNVQDIMADSNLKRKDDQALGTDNDLENEFSKENMFIDAIDKYIMEDREESNLEENSNIKYAIHRKHNNTLLNGGSSAENTKPAVENSDEHKVIADDINNVGSPECYADSSVESKQIDSVTNENKQNGSPSAAVGGNALEVNFTTENDGAITNISTGRNDEQLIIKSNEVSTITKVEDNDSEMVPVSIESGALKVDKKNNEISNAEEEVSNESMSYSCGDLKKEDQKQTSYTGLKDVTSIGVTNDVNTNLEVKNVEPNAMDVDQFTESAVSLHNNCEVIEIEDDEYLEDVKNNASHENTSDDACYPVEESNKASSNSKPQEQNIICDNSRSSVNSGENAVHDDSQEDVKSNKNNLNASVFENAETDEGTSSTSTITSCHGDAVLKLYTEMSECNEDDTNTQDVTEVKGQSDLINKMDILSDEEDNLKESPSDDDDIMLVDDEVENEENSQAFKNIRDKASEDVSENVDNEDNKLEQLKVNELLDSDDGDMICVDTFETSDDVNAVVTSTTRLVKFKKCSMNPKKAKESATIKLSENNDKTIQSLKDEIIENKQQSEPPNDQNKEIEQDTIDIMPWLKRMPREALETSAFAAVARLTKSERRCSVLTAENIRLRALLRKRNAKLYFLEKQSKKYKFVSDKLIDELQQNKGKRKAPRISRSVGLQVLIYSDKDSKVTSIYDNLDIPADDMEVDLKFIESKQPEVIELSEELEDEQTAELAGKLPDSSRDLRSDPVQHLSADSALDLPLGSAPVSLHSALELPPGYTLATPSDSALQLPPHYVLELPQISQLDSKPVSPSDLPEISSSDVPPDSSLELRPNSLQNLSPNSSLGLPGNSSLNLPPDSSQGIPPDSSLHLPPDSSLDSPSDPSIVLQKYVVQESKIENEIVSVDRINSKLTIPVLSKPKPGPISTVSNKLELSPKPEKRPAPVPETVDLTDDEPPPKQVKPNSPRCQTLTSPNSGRRVYIPISGVASPRPRPGQTSRPIICPLAKGSGPALMRVPQNSNLRLRHPAPLPESKRQIQSPLWKSIPPAPDLKISKVGNGIVISWKIDGYLHNKYEEIASYQLYAYQESTALPKTEMWKKIGDVKALPLPMACTLTQFMSGFKYYFAVRAVDIRSRIGPFSLPGSILLLSKQD